MTTTAPAAAPATTAPAPVRPRRRRTSPGRVIAWIVMIVIFSGPFGVVLALIFAHQSSAASSILDEPSDVELAVSRVSFV